ncbi:MAG TPA: CCA tRNA nucleotidyltransferase [Patescibacteria group bacterium]|nr:CCA tRNA nucleotidyltransferase [Patescibacteria group bacterium]
MKHEFIVPEIITRFMAVFKNKDYRIYIVGGALRELLRGFSPSNWDFTTNATPEQIQQLFADNFYHNEYGTVTVKYENNLFEVTPFRTEEDYTDLRHPQKITWAKNIEEDLARRDFTINAIAFDGRELIDPHHGIADIKEKIIRAVGDPDKRFSEDALRLMRAVRIATEVEFTIEDKTRAALMKNSYLLAKISKERVRDELFKILKSDYAADGILLLKNTGLLAHIIPELDYAFSIPQKSPGRHHIYDVGTHLVMSLKSCRAKDPIVRLAVLLHDIGKPATFKKDEKTGLITFFNHEVAGGHLVKKIAHDLRLSTTEKNRLFTLVRFHQFTVSELQTDKAIRRFIRDVGKENLTDMLILRDADRIGSGAKPTSWRYELFKKRLVEVQKEPFQITDLKIDGNDVMKTLHLKPGPRVGQILQKLFNEVVEKKLKNEREILLKKLKTF